MPFETFVRDNRIEADPAVDGFALTLPPTEAPKCNTTIESPCAIPVLVAASAEFISDITGARADAHTLNTMALRTAGVQVPLFFIVPVQEGASRIGAEATDFFEATDKLAWMRGRGAHLLPPAVADRCGPEATIAPVVVIGGTSSTIALDAAQLASRNAIPFLSQAATTTRLRDASAYPFFLRSTGGNDGLARGLVEVMWRQGIQHAALVAERSDYTCDLAQQIILFAGHLSMSIEVHSQCGDVPGAERPDLLGTILGSAEPVCIAALVYPASPVVMGRLAAHFQSLWTLEGQTYHVQGVGNVQYSVNYTSTHTVVEAFRHAASSTGTNANYNLIPSSFLQTYAAVLNSHNIAQPNGSVYPTAFFMYDAVLMVGAATRALQASGIPIGAHRPLSDALMAQLRRTVLSNGVTGRIAIKPGTNDREAVPVKVLSSLDASGELQQVGELRDAGFLSTLGCPPGQTRAFQGSAACSLCVAGKYKGAFGPTQCTDCPSGMTTAMEGAVSQDNCTCPAGFVEVEVALATPEELSRLLGVSQRVASQRVSCVDCARYLPGAKCEGVGLSLSRVPSMPGYWRGDELSVYFARCSVPTRCPGGVVDARANGTAAMCAPGYAGYTCGGCEEGYGRLDPLGAFMGCGQCGSRVLSLTVTAAAVLAGTLLLTVLARHIANAGWRSRKSQRRGQNVKVVLNYLQLLSLVMSTAQTSESWQSRSAGANWVTQSVSAAWLSIPVTSCMLPSSRDMAHGFWFVLLVGMAVLAMSFVVVYVTVPIWKGRTIRDTQDTVLATAIFFVYFLITPLTTTALRLLAREPTFASVNVRSLLDDGPGLVPSVLRASPVVAFSEPPHSTIVLPTAAIMCFAGVVLAPAAVALLLWHSRRVLHVQTNVGIHDVALDPKLLRALAREVVAPIDPHLAKETAVSYIDRWIGRWTQAALARRRVHDRTIIDDEYMKYVRAVREGMLHAVRLPAVTEAANAHMEAMASSHRFAEHVLIRQERSGVPVQGDGPTGTTTSHTTFSTLRTGALRTMERIEPGATGTDSATHMGRGSAELENGDSEACSRSLHSFAAVSSGQVALSCFASPETIVALEFPAYATLEPVAVLGVLAVAHLCCVTRTQRRYGFLYRSFRPTHAMFEVFVLLRRSFVAFVCQWLPASAMVKQSLLLAAFSLFGLVHALTKPYRKISTSVPNTSKAPSALLNHWVARLLNKLSANKLESVSLFLLGATCSLHVLNEAAFDQSDVAASELWQETRQTISDSMFEVIIGASMTLNIAFMICGMLIIALDSADSLLNGKRKRNARSLSQHRTSIKNPAAEHGGHVDTELASLRTARDSIRLSPWSRKSLQSKLASRGRATSGAATLRLDTPPGASPHMQETRTLIAGIESRPGSSVAPGQEHSRIESTETSALV